MIEKPTVNLNDVNIEPSVNPLPIFTKDLFGRLKVVDTTPSVSPTIYNAFDQVVLYKNGSTYRLYWFDGTGWRYAAGT